MATPGKPRQSAIPAPAMSRAASGIPTPGRPRSSASVYHSASGTPIEDDHEISRALADALRANDPAQHRTMAPPISLVRTTSTSLSPKSSLAQSGRRSVATGRPPSSASTSSALSSSTRASAGRTPVAARTVSRPPSRHADLHPSKNRTFEVGDNVRIESLGFEGVLRYLGPIDGKPGQWAGVELSGGFTGKGKNNGTVGGTRYFECPPSCGVFVALTKLSPPTVGHGARPPSVASARNGRVTPAMSGRITPSYSASMYSYASTRTPSASFSNGRTPSAPSGRVTPSMSTSRTTATTPSLKARTTPKPLALQEKITAGSRAAKYANMTAKDLSNSKSVRQTPASPSPKTNRVTSGESPRNSRILANGSPRSARVVSQGSPIRGPGSPFSTPRAMASSKFQVGYGKSRSGNTPRARAPSSASMPPPSSPFSAKSMRSSRDDEFDEVDSISRFQLPTQPRSRPGSSASVRSDDAGLVDRLQSRLDALEYENERLRKAATAALSPNEQDESEDRAKELEELKSQKQEAIERLTRIEDDLKVEKSLTASQRTQLSSLSADVKSLRQELEKVRAEDQTTIDGLKSEKIDLGAELEQLRRDLVDWEIAQSDLQDNLHVKEADIEALQSNVALLTAELEEERRELGGQIEELRTAGQETIALYEERLSAVEDQRYDLEARLNALIEKAVAPDEPVTSTLSPRTAETAAEIDNETLREQVHHLQKKISMMEDIIEDHQANAEKEEAAHQERMKRLKDKEDAMKKELAEGKKEVERVVRAEVSARNRVEEIEEALRESTVTLENARAETEALRAELANLDGLIEGEGDLSTRITEWTRRMGQEREQKEREVRDLKLQLQDALRQMINGSPDEDEVEDLKAELTRAKADLEDRERDVRDLKKRLREVPVNNGVLDVGKGLSPKNDGGKEEVTGLKHIVQEMQKENSSAVSKIRMLESENEHLRSEVEQLRQEVRILEDNLDNSLHNEETTTSPADDSPLLQKRTKEQGLEIEQLRKKLSDMEVKHGRTIHDLNKEIGELEALVESKIYREDELEQEIDRLKDKISRAKKSSRPSTEPVQAQRLSVASSSESEIGGTSEVQVCEICERPGHDIFNCDLLKEDVSIPASRSASSEIVCEDCETPGHRASECPYSQDVF